MQKIKIGVMDDEKEYVTRLISYLQEYSKGRWDLCAFTNIQALECYLDKRALDILIGTDRSILDKHRRNNDGICMWLTEQRCDYREEAGKLYVIYRFQSAREIGKCIERIIENEKKYVEEDKSLIAIYSPVGRCGKTTMALDVVNSGRYGKWLYFGLEDYSSFEDTDSEKRVIMDELLYYWKERKEDKLLALMEQSENTLVSGTSFLDEKQIKVEDFRWIRNLMLQSKYKGILFDVGTGIIQDFRLFREFDKVIVPFITEEKAMTKRRNFEKLFDLQEMEEDKKRLCFIDMSKDISVIKKEIFGGLEY